MKNKKQIKKQNEILEAYQKVATNNPEITDERKLELLTRKYIFNMKIRRAGMLCLSGVLSTFVLAYTSVYIENFADRVGGLVGDLISLLLAFATMSAASLVIVGVCKFASSLHDSLTTDEARELAEKDAKEKGGVNHLD